MNRERKKNDYRSKHRSLVLPNLNEILEPENPEVLHMPDKDRMELIHEEIREVI